MTLVRRSAAFTAVPVLVVAELYAIFSRGTPWWGEWNWSVDWANGATILLGPLVAGCGAFDVSTWRGSRVRGLLRSVPRGALSSVLLTAANAAVGCAVQLGGLAIVLVMNLLVGAGGLPDLRTVPLALLVLLASASVGAGVGLALPALFAAPSSVVVVFAGTYLASGGTVPPYLRVGGSTGSLLGLTWNPVLALVVAAGLVLTVVAVAGALVLSDSPVRPRVARLVLALGSAGFAATYVVLSVGPSDRLQRTSAVISYECRGERPRVCLAEQTSRRLEPLAQALHEAARPLRQVGVPLVDRYRQVVPGRALPRDAGPLFIESEALNRSPSPVPVAAYLTTPAGCPQYTGSTPPPQALFDAQRLLQQWILLRTGAEPLAAFAAEPGHAWLSRTTAAQADWIRRTYGQLLSCDLDAVALPPGVE
ncbi:hypothetical protein AERO_18085 [Aeromicrobium fastidiosum]|uniref:hypothetical protein n=1 Tax=Aeromicrobium fastidiosum TaxID=52699 RepID=UPI0020234D90|nr:hypothetical protein [Aeromicrobium fastidiosum]MCL8253294.1 hypothetical protein [Aeromicrobium fastidiosum]